MKFFRFKNIRVQLFTAFLAAAVLVAILQGVGILTIQGINGRARVSSSDIQQNLDQKIEELAQSLAITDLSERILRADTHAGLQEIDPHIDLSGMADVDGEQTALLLSQLHARKGDFLLHSESLAREVARFQTEVEALSAEIDSTVTTINGAAIAQAEKVQLDLSEATKGETARSLEEMQGTVNGTLENVINTLQLRNDLFAFEIQVRQAESGEAGDPGALLAELGEIRAAVGTLPGSVAGDFEIAAINGLLDQIEAGLQESPAPATELAEAGAVELDDHFGDLQNRLLTIADNVVFDSSFELESYLGDVRTSIGGSLDGLIATQEELNAALAAASDLEHQGALIRENLNAIIFQLQRTLIEQTPEAVERLQSEAHKRLEAVAAGRESLLTSLAASSADSTRASLDARFAELVAHTSGENGLLTLASSVVNAQGEAQLANAAIDQAVSGISQAMAISFEALAESTTAQLDQNIAAGTRARNWLLSLGCAILLLALGMGIFIPRSLSARIGRIVGDLGRVARNLGHSANAMTQSSDTQARSASEQAATLEESSATLVGLSQMANKNAQTTEQASRVFEQTRQLTTDGTAKMDSMQSAMADIVEASKQIEKIIRTIEEIAFQTNILALNAAVEAARAGEAGAGFGVVAEEVRNLAQKCTEAARDTSKIIQSNENRTSQGTQLCDAVGKSLAEINQQVEELNQMVAGIARATKEQSEGIEQLNSGVQSMSAKTQDNAAVAEEGAATSTELDRDARNLRQMLERLRELSGTRLDPDDTEPAAGGDDEDDDAAYAPTAGRLVSPVVSAASGNGSSGNHHAAQSNGDSGDHAFGDHWSADRSADTTLNSGDEGDDGLDQFFSPRR